MMEGFSSALNNGYYFVIAKIVELQAFFINTAWGIGRTIFLIALFSAALNYALTGSGFKENIIKIGKATVFFFVIMFAYPKVIAFITSWTYDMAKGSMYPAIESYYTQSKTVITDGLMLGAANKKTTFTKDVLVKPNQDPLDFFDDLEHTDTYSKMEISTIAPAAVLKLTMLIAGECFSFADKNPGGVLPSLPPFKEILLGLICGFFIIVTGIFAILEYLMAFLEFMLISSVGVILFPLSIWEGSKFMSEKFIGAIIGFFVKLLFCNITIFLLLYGFLSIAQRFALNAFGGGVDEVIFVLFTCLLFFFICKSAPALAQSLLTGTPSLSTTGAISAAAGVVGAAGATLGMAKTAGRTLAGGAAKAAFGGGGALVEAASAAQAVGTLDGGKGAQAAAFAGSLGKSALESVKASGGDLARSLIGDRGGGRGNGSSTGTGINRHSQSQQFLSETNADGRKKSFKEYVQSRKDAGTNAGQDYMYNQEKRRNANTIQPRRVWGESNKE